VTTLAGSAKGCGSVDGVGDAARFGGPSAIAVDKAGNAFVADSEGATIRKVTSAGVVTTLAGSLRCTGHTDGTGSMARFRFPSGVAVDSAGNLFVADEGNGAVRKVTPAGAVTTLASRGRSKPSKDGPARAALGNYPTAVAVDSEGNVFVVDRYDHTLRKVSPAGEITTLAGEAGSSGSNDGPGSAARFKSPRGVAVDRAGSLFVADTENCTIRKVTPAGEVTTLAGQAGARGDVDGLGDAARFRFPFGVAVDGAGNLFVADLGNGPIRKVTPAGAVTTLAGEVGGAYGVAVDDAGNVFVADHDGHTIRMVTPAGIVTTIGGVAGVMDGRDGVGSAARFAAPSGVAVDKAGNLYVADELNNRITKGVPVHP
jgi:sugar lactone lactonase YvrE